MPPLLVASGGGHLQQLVELAPRLQLGDPLWVTYDTVQTRSLLGEQAYVGAHHPTTKNLGNAFRNTALARRVLSEYEVDCIVSTGAAVAVPFMTVARTRGIPCHYIESATRVSGPSLSGRLLEAVPGVQLYRQMGSWGGSRWLTGPCVFDGFNVSRRASKPVRRVLVSLGTHNFPHDRLVQQLARVLDQAGITDVVWQVGSTIPPPDLPGRVEYQVPWQEFGSLMESVDVVVGHAGTGLCLTALNQGKVPVVAPRRRARGEHTDDHQAQIAAELGARGLVVRADAGLIEMADLNRAAGMTATWTTPPPYPLQG